MSIRPTTSTTSGIGAYQKSMRTQRMEEDAARVADTLRTQRVEATVRTRSFGFSMGGFGIDFTTRDVELPGQEIPTAPRPRSSFSDALDAAALLRETSGASKSATGGEQEPLSADKALSRRKALEAYASAALAHFRPVPGHLGNV